jgi:GT2 family glycosyltransferase
MLLYADGTSKQRGHRKLPERYTEPVDVLLPSGSAALYRRSMLDQTGGFDEDFFLYCEDTDLGLRARWAGWECGYVPEAIVDHHYSQSSGRASALKAYYVERNRLRLVIKNFPTSMLAPVPWHAAKRYAWHLVTLISGRGAAGDFHKGGGSPLHLIWFVARAHASAIWNLPRLLRQRRRIRRSAAITAGEFVNLARRHSITAREVASL